MPLKNLLTGCLRSVAVLVLVVEGDINWGYCLPMAFGRVNRSVLRAVVIVIGVGLAAPSPPGCQRW